MGSRLDIVLLGATGYTGKHTAKSFAVICKDSEYANITWGIAGRSTKKMLNLLTELKELGATGYTGKHTARSLAVVCKDPEYANITWGIAGRSMKKMQNLLTELKDLGIDTTKVPLMECDIVNNKYNIQELTKRAKVLMNATGANTLLSEPIVKACIDTRTHYVDISAELYHMVNIFRTYNTAAEQVNVLIIPACGFSSIPVVAGLIQLERNFKGLIKNVECYAVLDIPTRANFPFPGHNNSLIHYGTWESLVQELKNYKKMKELRKNTFNLEHLPRDLQKPFFHRHKGRFWYPYPGPDSSIVQQTQQYQSEKGKTPYHFTMYTTMPLFIHFLIVVPVFFIYYLMCHFNWFSKLLCNFPRLFTAGLASHKGPSEKMRKDTKFSFNLNGSGWNHDANVKSETDRKLTVRVAGNDPGYQTTATCFIFAAITILREGSNMPSGGVLSAGAAFNDTNLSDKLVKHGIQIDVVE